MRIVDEVEGLYKIVEFDVFRITHKATFDMIPLELFAHIDSMDRVIHENDAISPAPMENVPRPWYMHKYQDDNLIVFHGTRFVDLYTHAHGIVESFMVTPNEIYKNGELVAKGSVLLVWPRGVFHRIQSGNQGSASLNVAVHYDGFDLKTNFDVYELDIQTGTHNVIHEGFRDQLMFSYE